MKNKTESNWEVGIDNFGILATQNRFGILPTYNQYETVVPYDEARDRWTLRTKDTARSQQMKTEKALPVEMAKGQQEQRGFWFRFFGQKA